MKGDYATQEEWSAHEAGYDEGWSDYQEHNMQMTDREMLFYVMGRLDLSQPHISDADQEASGGGVMNRYLGWLIIAGAVVWAALLAWVV